MRVRPIIFAFFSVFFYFNVSAQTYNSFYGKIVANTSSSNILKDLNAFERFGEKVIGSNALENTQNWIISRYQSLGYTDVVLQPFSYNNKTSNNIIVTKTGTVYPNTFLIIDAHYDTINGPGTNDNGTGTVLLLELARLFQNVATEYSIKFIHFSGEENGLIGSKFYVKNTVIPENLDIKLVFNIDEVGGVAGMINDTIVCENDQKKPQSNNDASATATAALAKCIELYSNLNTEISFAYSSDYIPFQDKGYVITGLYEKNISPVNHTINDDLAHMDPNYAFEVLKGALGAAFHFSAAYDDLSADSYFISESDITVEWNALPKELSINLNSLMATAVDFRLVDVHGQDLLNKQLIKQNETIKFDSLRKGIYLAVFKLDNHRVIKKITLN